MIRRSNKRQQVYITLVALITMLLTSCSGVLMAAPKNTRYDSQQVTAAKTALIAASPMVPVEGDDTNAIAMAQAIVNSAASGVTVQIVASANSQVATNGAISYGAKAVTGSVNFKLIKNNTVVSLSVAVAVPAAAASEDPPEPIIVIPVGSDADEVAAAESALASLASGGTLKPVEGTNTNIVPIAQAIVDAASSGVTVTVYSSANAQVALNGAITYGSAAVTGNVAFLLQKNQAMTTQQVTVVVPAHLVSQTNQLPAAQAALAAAGTFRPVEGTNSSIIPMAQTIVNTASSGVTVTVASSANSQVASNGAITYGSSAVTGNVIFTLTQSGASVAQSVTVAVPAHAVTDAELVSAAKSALAAAGTLKPVEGNNSNVVPMAQATVNTASTGVTVTVANSANSQVASDGIITYGTSEVTGLVTFKLSKGSASVTQALSVTVPAKAVTVTAGYNVKNYGAKGDGVTDDTAAVQKTIDTVYANGGGTVYVPDGTYMINAATSINLKSNITLSLADNATLQAKPCSNSIFFVIQARNVSNIAITGGKIIGERASHPGPGNYGDGIGIYSCNNVYIADISISDCWGDGIYVGSAYGSSQNYCQNVLLEKFVIDNCCRNGITVISAKSLTIRDGLISNTNGSRPETGLDLEPNTSSEVLQNILIENLVTKYIANVGILVSLPNYANLASNPLDITIKNHQDYYCGFEDPYYCYMYTPSSTCKVTYI